MFRRRAVLHPVISFADLPPQYPRLYRLGFVSSFGESSQHSTVNLF